MSLRARSRSARRPRAALARLARWALLLCLGLAVAWGLWRVERVAAGEPSALLAERWHAGHEVLDRRGRTLRELPSEAGNRGKSLALSEMGERLVLATIVSEDRRFFDHTGIDPAAIARAIGQNAAEVRLVSGASTITQQLVKLLDTRGEPGPRTLSVKVRESARAQNLEEVLDKTDILAAYLNRLGYGRGLVGPDAAARGYFGVASTELSWAQAAYLAVLPRAPSYLDPYRHPERATRRQALLLDALHEHGVLSQADWERARSETVAVKLLAAAWHAPHLVDTLRAEGKLAAGASTTTTIELELQAEVQGFVQTHVEALAARGVHDAAVVVVDNPSGEVLAYVGNAMAATGDAPPQRAAAAPHIDMARTPRQPGSALKPFVYALGFAEGHSAAELLADVPTVFGRGGGGYAPGNFDGVFRGPVSAREALAGSLNVPAVRLADELPHGALLELLRELGVRSLRHDADHYGLALALGSGELSLRELAAVYAALARGGSAVELRYVSEPGHRLGERAPGTRRLDPAVAALVSETLSDPLARVRGLGGRGPFDFGFPVAVKTGTSSGYRDSWCVGYTRERTVAVWIGNADGSPTAELTGGTGAGPLFVDVMRRAMRDVASRESLWDPDLLEQRPVCPLSGLPVGPACPAAVMRSFVRGAASAHAEPHACTLHRHASARSKQSPAEPPWRCDEHGAARIVVLPPELSGWLAEQPLGAPGRDAEGLAWFAAGTVPGCELAALSERARLRIESPASGSVLVLSRAAAAHTQQLELRASVTGSTTVAAVDAVEFVLDGQLVGRSRAPFRASVPATPGDHELVVRPADERAQATLAVSRFSVR